MRTLTNIKIADCFLSKTNTAGRNEGKSFDELVESIKEKGILSPILVRAVGKKYEVVAGNRRFAAAKVCEHVMIPAMVAVMSDIEAREAQIVENLQRADIHPLDEGEAYRGLIEKSKYSLEDIATKVGKSVTYVRDRLVLTNLLPVIQKAFRAGEFRTAIAPLIARLDEPLQKQMFEEVDETTTTEEMRNWIQNAIFDSKKAPWKDDEQMKAMLKGCEECEGKGGDLFGKKAADTCTNPQCYAQKLTAYIAIKLQENPGMKKLSSNWGQSNEEGVLAKSEYHEINSKKDQCKSMEKAIIVEGDGMGRVVNICNDMACKKHNAEITKKVYKQTPEEKEARKKEQEKVKKQKEKDRENFQNALAKVKWPLSEKQLDALFEFAFNRCGFSYQQPVAQLLGLEPVKKSQKDWGGEKVRQVSDWEATLKKYAKENGNVGKLRVIVGLLIPHPSENYVDGFKKAEKKL